MSMPALSPAIPTAGDRRFVSATMSAPLLEREHERELARRWIEDGDEAALHELTVAHARLVIRIASGFKGSGLPIADLIQEGNVGLMQSASRFDPTRGVRFSTYATWWIVAAIQSYILRNVSMVRAATTPRQRRLFFGIRRARSRRVVGYDGRFTFDDHQRLADMLGVSVKEVANMDAYLSRPDQSLNAPLSGDSQLEQQDLLQSNDLGPEDLTIRQRDGAARRAWIDQAMSRLSPRERHIVDRRFLGERRVTLSEIGKSFGVSKERVRQIEARALRKMREALVELVERPDEVFDF